MRKILFIHPFFPYPLLSGGHQALYNGILSVKDNYDVFLAYKAIEGEDYQRYKNSFITKVPNVHLLPMMIKLSKPSSKQLFLQKTKKAIKRLFGIKAPQPRLEDPIDKKCKEWINAILPLQRRWTEHISDVCNRYQFDIIQVEMPWMVSQILTLPSKPQKIYIHHELGFIRRGLEINSFNNNDFAKACKRFADLNEIALLNKYDAVVTLSPTDKEKLVNKGVSVPIYTSLAIVNTKEEYILHKCDGLRLTFLGTSQHLPNLTGLLWFLENCWERLLSYDNQYTIEIIGKWDEQLVKDITAKYPRICFKGFVDNLTDALRGSILIIPITIGSGIRMKILEACSIGVPFVSTSVGAEGIPVVNGIHCFIADAPDKFVDSIIKLKDNKTQELFGRNAYRMVKDKYSEDVLKHNRLSIYNSILNGAE